MFNKIFFFILFTFFLMFFFCLNFNSHLFFGSNFNFSLEEKLVYFHFNVSLDGVSYFFLGMVSLVTSLVFLYSSFYMESYNNKKFFFLTLLFFSFMSVLSCSGGIMNSLIGWDGLGVSSLFLIMFYPNKITYFNSFLTFFFNRLGDIFFLSFFLFFLSNYSFFFFYTGMESLIMALIFFACLMTKSAQFPFSSWLPAAMSAPTPISAMVHSSTLVTAGILILMKMSNFFYTYSLYDFLIVLSILTFLVGGFLGMMELDLKKIVAFSTMSQISMILFFISSGMLSMALFHTLSHALFKTLLFCSCGVVFLFNFSDQNLKNLSGKSLYSSLFMFFLISIFSMSGIIFSSSFFSKDLILELFLDKKNFFFFFSLLLGSFFTIFYSGKIFSSLIFSPSFKYLFSTKITYFFFIFFFSACTIFLMKFYFGFFFMDYTCFVSKIETFAVGFIIPILFFCWTKKFSMISSMEVMFMKLFSFSLLKKSVKTFPHFFFVSDSIFFKPSILKFNSLSFNFLSFSFLVYPFIMSLSIFFF